MNKKLTTAADIINMITGEAGDGLRGVVRTRLVYADGGMESSEDSFMDATKAAARHLETRRRDDAPAMLIVIRDGDEEALRTQWFLDLVGRTVKGKLVNGKEVAPSFHMEQGLLDLVSQPLFS